MSDHSVNTVNTGGSSPLVPNSIIRSALFSTNRMGNRREFIRNVRIASLPQYEVSFSGLELNQRDCEVFYACVNTIHNSERNFDKWFSFSTSHAVEMMGMPNDGRSARFVWESLERLKHGNIRIKSFDGSEYIGSLLSEICLDRRGECRFKMPETIARLFDSSDQTYLRLKTKASIPSLLGKWMFDFYSSHSQTIPVPVERLMELTGTKLPKNKFKYHLKECLSEVMSCDKPPFKSFEFDGDRLVVYKASMRKKEEKENPFD